MAELEGVNPVVEHRKGEILNSGFRQIGQTGFFSRSEEGFVLGIDPKSAQYNFFINYPSVHLSRIQALAVEESSKRDNDSVLQVLDYEPIRGYRSVVGYYLNGSGGGMFGNDTDRVDSKLTNLAKLPISQQLKETGFVQDAKDPDVWKREFRFRSEKPQEVIVITKDGQLVRILKPLDPNLLKKFKIDENSDIIAAREEQARFSQVPHDVLTIQNDLLRLDLASDHNGYVSSATLMREALPEEIGVKKYSPTPDEFTPDFLVGGVNSTQVIKNLKGLHTSTIEELEDIMHPSEYGGGQTSMAGFLGESESLIDTLATDNDFVLRLGLTHQDLAFPLKYVKKLTQLGYGKEFTFKGTRYKIDVTSTMGIQQSPFGDNTGSGDDVTIQNLATGETLTFGLLLADMIERWGFYEGKGSKYRLEPEAILKVFPYLKDLSNNQ